MNEAPAIASRSDTAPHSSIPLMRVANDWQGETAVIVASGPSLADEDLSLIAGLKTVVLNDAVRLVPDGDVFLLCDPHWIRAHPDLGNLYRGPSIVVLRAEAVATIDPRMTRLRRGPTTGILSNREELAGNYTAVSHALSFAAHKGVARALILGCDLQPGENGERHFDRAGRDTKDAALRYRMMGSVLASQAAPLKAAGIDVINCSRRSRLSCFRHLPLSEAVRL